VWAEFTQRRNQARPRSDRDPSRPCPRAIAAYTVGVFRMKYCTIGLFVIVLYSAACGHGIHFAPNPCHFFNQQRKKQVVTSHHPTASISFEVYHLCPLRLSLLRYLIAIGVGQGLSTSGRLKPLTLRQTPKFTHMHLRQIITGAKWYFHLTITPFQPQLPFTHYHHNVITPHRTYPPDCRQYLHRRPKRPCPHSSTLLHCTQQHALPTVAWRLLPSPGSSCQHRLSPLSIRPPAPHPLWPLLSLSPGRCALQTKLPDRLRP